MSFIVQSLYNVTVENTSLAFEVCNNTVGDCDNGLSTTTMGFVITEMPNGPNEQNPVIIIVIASEPVRWKGRRYFLVVNNLTINYILTCISMICLEFNDKMLLKS